MREEEVRLLIAEIIAAEPTTVMPEARPADAPATATSPTTPEAARAVPSASRPAAAKLSLLFRGWAACRRIAVAWQTPPVQWALPDWDAPTWSRQAQQVYNGAPL